MFFIQTEVFKQFRKNTLKIILISKLLYQEIDIVFTHFVLQQFWFNFLQLCFLLVNFVVKIKTISYFLKTGFTSIMYVFKQLKHFWIWKFNFKLKMGRTNFGKRLKKLYWYFDLYFNKKMRRRTKDRYIFLYSNAHFIYQYTFIFHYICVWISVVVYI